MEIKRAKPKTQALILFFLIQAQKWFGTRVPYLGRDIDLFL